MRFFCTLFIIAIALGLHIDRYEVDLKIDPRASLNLGVAYYHSEDWGKAEYWLLVAEHAGYPAWSKPQGTCQNMAGQYLGMLDQDRRERELMKGWR